MAQSVQIATHNPGKLKEFQALFGASLTMEAAPSDWPVPVENGKSYRENAEIKARSLWRHTGEAALSDDSGLEIRALGDAPGIDSAVYGGETLDWQARWELVFKELTGHSDRRARFRAVLCYFDGSEPRFFEGTVEGEITRAPAGTKGFGYDPIFFCPELGKTFGEASLIEKDRGRSERVVFLLCFRSYLCPGSSVGRAED
jgi:XTP/dITP diphosphohydrolase